MPAASGGFEFQRLHGMGEKLYEALLGELPDLACRVYAPVGRHRDLLAYLVRRLLENGANSSFVALAADPSVPIAHSLRGRRIGSQRRSSAPSQHAVAARSLSAGAAQFGRHRIRRPQSLDGLLADFRAGLPREPAVPSSPASRASGTRARRAFADRRQRDRQRAAMPPGDAAAAMAAAAAGFAAWARTPVDARAAALERAADLPRSRTRPTFSRCSRPKAARRSTTRVAEIREAVDYCLYYAAQARSAARRQAMPGPTGESNVLLYRGRGLFVCISPWNFPLAIFLGQVDRGTRRRQCRRGETGRTDAARRRARRCFAAPRRHSATALHFVPGDGEVGAALVADPRVAGVAFTGSTEVAWRINRALAAKTARSCR